MLLYKGAALAIAATKVSAGLKLEKAAIASSKKTPWNDNHCHECKQIIHNIAFELSFTENPYAKMRIPEPSSNFDFSIISVFQENPYAKT